MKVDAADAAVSVRDDDMQLIFSCTYLLFFSV